MKNIYPIILSFNASPISRKSLDTYKDFTKELFKANGEDDIEIANGFPYIIRLKSDDKNDFASDYIKTQIEVILKAKKLITNDNNPQLNFIKDKIIVIDFLTKNAIDSKNEFHFLYFIDSILERSSNVEEQLKFVILANRIYDESNFDNKNFFEKHVDNKHILLFDNLGNSYQDKYNQIELFNKYRRLIFGDVYELFKRKLIGKIGHFKRRNSNNNHIRCHLFFYDGSHCEEELIYILRQKFSENDPDFIIYDCPESDWLVKSIKIATPYYSTNKETFSVFQYKEDSNEIAQIPKGNKGILIFDLVHKGTRLSEVYKNIIKLNPGIANNLKTISILKAVNSSNYIFQETNQTDTFEDIEYDFIHKVYQKDYLLPSCEMCNTFKIDETPKDGEIQSSLQSYFFWRICSEEFGVGFNTPEKNKPKERNALPIVPNFQKLLSIHGAYLSYKMKRLLEINNITNLKEYTFICPDEEGAKEVGKSIGYFFDAEVIRIDKETIKRIIDNGMNKTQIITEFKESDWVSYLLEIEETGKSKSAIIFDEFAFSNNTLKNYSAVIRKFDFQIGCYFPLFSFSDLKMEDNKPVLSLYSFNLFSTNAVFNFKSENEYK